MREVRLRLPTVACALLAAVAPTLVAVEASFSSLRELDDRIRIAAARGKDPIGGKPLSTLRGRLSADKDAVAHGLSALSPGSLTGEDRRAVELMRRFVDQIAGPGENADATPQCAQAESRQKGPEGFDHLSARLYACFGAAADSIDVGSEKVDRLTILDRLAREGSSARRKELFLAMEPLYRAVNGDDDAATSPYRALVGLSAARWKAGDSPVERSLRALDVPSEALEPWLLSILEAWRDATAPTAVEPWDVAYTTSAADRLLADRIPLGRLRAISNRFYASLGADPEALGIRYDLEPRPGKSPVAFTDFGARPRLRNGRWTTGEPWVFATYRTGGLGNLVELLHETGHAIHIAAIHTRPAFADWPDSDTFTEALADLPALESFEPEWQRRYLGREAPLAESLRSKYGSIVLDVAWALFELRLHRDPGADPNSVWTELTEGYLHVVPHREISWWARRGQLVESPGYMVNYALGAIIVADLRARCRVLRGSMSAEDPGYYSWLSERLYRYGLEKTSGDVIREFLGRNTSPAALIADLGRAGDATRPPEER
jgi:hypothetical protein